MWSEKQRGGERGEGWGVGGENADTAKDGQIDDDEQGKKMERTETRQCL